MGRRLHDVPCMHESTGTSLRQDLASLSSALLAATLRVCMRMTRGRTLVFISASVLSHSTSVGVSVSTILTSAVGLPTDLEQAGANVDLKEHLFKVSFVLVIVRCPCRSFDCSGLCNGLTRTRLVYTHTRTGAGRR